MTMIEVACPDCQRCNVIKAGKQPNGAQRYRCQTPTCPRTIFQLTYTAQGRLPETQRQIVEMALNGSGIRDTARVLRVSPVTVLRVLKKEPILRSVNRAALDTLTGADTDVLLARVQAAEI